MISIISHLIFFSSLPLVLIYNTIKFYTIGPPVPWMTLHSTLSSRIIKHYLYLTVGFYLPSIDGKEWDIIRPSYAKKARVGTEIEKVILGPISDDLRVDIGICENIQSVPRPGFMITPQGAQGSGTSTARIGEKVIMYIHGGAYILGHPLETPFACSMAKLTKLRLLGVNYRKTLNASRSFPAPLLDALSGYIYLTKTLNFPSKSIILLGDSAGGHLSLMLTRYLSILNLPQPKYLFLSSPWVDLTFSFPSITTNYPYDYLVRLSSKLLPNSLRYYPSSTRASVFFSPALGKPEDFSYLREGGMKVYIQVGTKEMLCDEIMALARKMKEGGVDLVLREEIDGLHCGALTRFKGSTAWEVWQKDVLELLEIDTDNSKTILKQS